MGTNKHQSFGFTIVELLIVIVVIAILAAITVVAYNGIQERARATAILNELKAAEKAFRSYGVTTGISSWWIDSSVDLTGSGNPTIDAIIAARPGFRDFLQRSPTTAGLSTSTSWIYDNEGDTYNGCAANSAGVNIAVSAITSTALMQKIDDIGDDSNLSCGKIRFDGSWLLYAISNNSTF